MALALITQYFSTLFKYSHCFFFKKILIPKLQTYEELQNKKGFQSTENMQGLTEHYVEDQIFLT